MPKAGIEPATQGFSVLCSTNWAIWAFQYLKYTIFSHWIKNCGGRIWTYDLRVMSPTSFQTAPPRGTNLIMKMDGEGFEPSKAVPTDLQSAPFGHSGTHPHKADDRTRTDNLLITNQLLCQLSHIGILTFQNDSNGNRTRVTAVKGRCLNRLTMEPKHIAVSTAI